MYPITMQQLNQLIHEVVSTYVWQFLAKVLNYDRHNRQTRLHRSMGSSH